MARFDAEVVVLVAALTSVESASAEELSTRVGFTVNDDHVRELREHGIISTSGPELFACFIPRLSRSAPGAMNLPPWGRSVRKRYSCNGLGKILGRSSRITPCCPRIHQPV